MKRPAHSKNTRTRATRIRIGALACACLIAIFVLAIGISAPSNPLSQNSTSIAPGQDQNANASRSQNQKPTATSNAESTAAPVSNTKTVVSDEGLAPHEAATVLISVPENSSRESVQQLLVKAPFVNTETIDDVELRMGLVELTITDGTSVSEAISKLERIPGIDAAQPNYVYSIAEDASETMGASVESGASGSGNALSTAANLPLNDAEAISEYKKRWQLESVNAFDAWDILGYSNSSNANPVGIAIIDTGANIEHADLQDRIVATYNCRNYSTDATDDDGHGTHVAGIAAATANNGIGSAGVSHNSNLVIIKGNDDDGYSTKALANGYQWLFDPYSEDSTQSRAEHYNIHVVNMSLGGPGTLASDNKLAQAITKARNEYGILTVCAAGNKNGTTSPDDDTVPYPEYPGDYSDCFSVINLQYLTPGVLRPANDASGKYYVERCETSNYNVSSTSTAKNISAPGTIIYSTAINGGYKYLSGTSMASPLVAGIAALVFAADDNLTPAQVVDVLQSTAADLGDPGRDAEYGYGEVDAKAAIASARGAYLNGNRVIARSGPSQSYTLENATGTSWEWTSSDETVATVLGNGDSATLTPVAAGTVTLTATDSADPDNKAEASITIIDPFIAGDGAVFSASSASYSIEGTGTDTLAWKWQTEQSSNTFSASIGAWSGVLTTSSPNLEDIEYVTLEATCLSNESIKVTKTVHVVPQAPISGLTQVYAGTSADYSIEPVEDLVWNWSVNEDSGATVENGTASTACTLSTAEGEATITLSATCANEGYESLTCSYAIGTKEPVISGPTEFFVEDSGQYSFAPDIVGAGYSYAWSVEGADCVTLPANMAANPITLQGKTGGHASLVLTITAPNKSTVTKTLDFATTSKDLQYATVLFQNASGEWVSPEDYIVPYTGERYAPEVKVFDGNTELTLGTDYIADAPWGTTNINASDTAYVTIEAAGGNPNGYTGTKTAYFTITPVDLSQANVSCDESDPFTYTSQPITPDSLSYSLGGVYAQLVKDVDYTISAYHNNIDAGDSASVEIEGIGNYAGSVQVYFSIARAGISVHQARNPSYKNGDEVIGVYLDDACYTLEGYTAREAGTYTATAIPTANYQWDDGLDDPTGPRYISWSITRAVIPVPSAASGLVYDGSSQTALAAPSQGEYTLSGTHSATDAGTYTATVTPTANYQWADGQNPAQPRNIEWTIERAPMTMAQPTTSFTYNANAQTALASTAHYTVENGTKTDAGTYTATVTPTKNYQWASGDDTTASRSFDWTINPKAIAIPTGKNLTYTASEQTGVSAGTGYTVSKGSATNAGTYNASVTPVSNYCWTDGTTDAKNVKYTIYTSPITSASVSVKDQDYTGSALTPAASVTWNGKTLAQNTDYTVSYADNVEVGTATLTVSGTGNFSGTKSASFKIIQTNLNGVYVISPINSAERAVNVGATTMKNGANVTLKNKNGACNQEWLFIHDSKSDTYTIRSLSSNKLLSVSGGKAGSGANVVQQAAKGANSQKWKIDRADNGYVISSALDSKLCLSIASTGDGANVLIRSGSTSNQVFALEKVAPQARTIADGIYEIAPNHSGKRLDVRGASMLNGANVRQYTRTGKANQRWKVKYNSLTGYYTITSVQSNKMLTVTKSGRKRGANIMQWKSTGAAAQRWIITKNPSSSTYTITSTYNKSLVVEVAKSSKKNGANVRLWTSNGNNNQKFIFRKVSSKQ